MCILFLYHALGDPPGGQPEPSTSSLFDNKSRTGIGGRYKLIVASNRDEWLDRPSAPIHFWKETKSNLLAGRDLTAGGTWLGVNRSGKFATVTNIPSAWDELVSFAEGQKTSTRATLVSTTIAVAAAAAVIVKRQGGGWVLSLGLLCAGIFTASVGLAVAVTAALRRSRGSLVSEFLKGNESAEEYGSRVLKDRWRYAGFNLVLVDSGSAWVLSNKGEEAVKRLPHGLYGVSNASLDTPWTKMLYGKSRVLEVLLRIVADSKLSEDALVDLLMDVLADDSACPPPYKSIARSMGKTWHALARVCIPPTALFRWWTMNGIRSLYGTRSSTVVLVDASGRMKVVERNFGDEAGGGTMRDAKRSTFEFCDV
ncbi:unnamed protein product [Ascophyllum nodosum]